MNITEVIIQNYHSIKNLKIGFKSLFGLIGANSAGKSNILKALNLVLGERYPMPHSLSKKDFYNEDFSNNILIQVNFDTSFKSYNRDCKGIIFRTKFDATNNSFTTEFRAIACVTNICQDWNIKGDCREQFPVIYIPATRNFEYHLQSNAEWSFLGKLIKQFNDIFPRDKVSELNKKFEDVKTTLETEKFKEFETSFKETFGEHVLPTENDVDIGFKAFDPKNYYKTIEIIPKEYSEIKNIDQMGEGMKNLIFISLLRAYAHVFPESTIFIIEEPELFLHPQGRADLFNIFKKLADAGSQIIYSTHSQEFIDIERFSNIGVVRKVSETTEHYTKLLQIDEANFLRKWKEKTGVENSNLDSIKLFLKNISDAETNKGFFARKIVLVEGPTEKWMLPIYAKQERLELEKNNIEIISVGGKNNIEKFYLLFKELGYLIYVIFDGDKSKVEGEGTNKKLTRLLSGTEKSWPETSVKENYSVFKDDIEAELKIQIQNFDKLVEDSRRIYGLKKGRSKEIIARYVANNTSTPEIIKKIIDMIKKI